jgi:hypothetical protein
MAIRRHKRGDVPIVLHLRRLAAVVALTTVGVLGLPAVAGASVATSSGVVPLAAVALRAPATTAQSGSIHEISTDRAPANTLLAPYSSGGAADASSALSLSSADVMALFVGGMALFSLGYLILTLVRRRVKNG